VKTIAADLLQHYKSGSTTLALAWIVTRPDGQVLGFTDHDQAIEVEGVTCGPSSAFGASAVSLRSELNTDNLDIVGLIESDGITVADIEAGKWDGSTVGLYRINWDSPSDGVETVLTGEIGAVQVRAGQYVAEVRGLMAKLQSNIGRVVVPTCNASLGDARCGVDLEALRVSSTVTAVTSRRAFAASTLSSGGVDYSGGELTFTAGANSGRSVEIRQHTGGGAVELFLPMPYDVQIGDTLTAVPGCDKIKATCIARYDNVLNFRGFSFVPGQDQTLLVGGQ